jgi:hypothetical protein
VEHHFQDLLNTISVILPLITHIQIETEQNWKMIHHIDTEVAIQSMRNNKAPGVDNIPIILYKK